ncbi:HAUS6 [Branchiostoma lanceolatum]|uniref:HAUS6 protein n=1 Tax=Branchiostoma lanceolatum TaxID=7740 RepID=A0A8J9ZKX5_BRALA|nr:HAUS6 [Branchiostoma lanceolatum]
MNLSQAPGPAGIMADPIDMREMFFTNLLLLGYDPTAMEAKHKIPFSRDMFALPNKKAFEVVTHYLFNRLDPIMAREAFRDCWPIYDKKGEQQFRRTVNNWMTQISREDAEANLPRIVASLFMSPGGDRFYNLMLHFSAFVILKATQVENGVKRRDIQERPTVLPSDLHLTPLMLTGVQAGLVRHRKKALDTAQTAQVLEAEWKQFANEQVKEHRHLSKKLRETERQENELLTESNEINRMSPSRRKAGGRLQHDDDMLRVKRTQTVHKVRELWKAVDELYTGTSQQREVVESILQGVLDKYKVDASKIDVRVPDLLLRECDRELQRRNIGDIYQGGKLNLLSFVQLSSLALHLYIEKLHEAGLPNFSDFSAEVSTQVHTHHAHLANAQSFRDTLADKMIPDLQESVARLTRELDSQYLPPEPNTQNSHPLSIPSLGLGLMPATPPVSFSPQEGTTGLTPAASLRRPSPEVSTPEVVSRLASSVHRAARRTTGLLAQGTPTYDRGVLTGEQTLRESIQPASKIPVKRREERPVQQPRTPPRVHQEVLRAPVAASPDTDNIFTPLKTDPKVRVETTPVHQRSRAQDMLASQSKQPMGDQRWRTPAGRQIEDPSTPSRGAQGFTPKAHQLLIDQIASAVAEERTPSVASSSDCSPPTSPPIQPLQDPLAALDESVAFTSRDRLARTPTSKPRPAPVWKDILSQEGRQYTPTRTLFPQDNANQEPPPIEEGLAGLPNGWPQSSKPRYPSIEDQESSESEKPSSPVGSVSTQSSLLSLLNGNEKGREGKPLEDLITFSSAESSVPSSMNGGKAPNGDQGVNGKGGLDKADERTSETRGRIRDGLEKDGGNVYERKLSSSSSVEEISTETMQRLPPAVTMMRIVTPLGLSDEIPSDIPIEELLGNLALDPETSLRTDPGDEMASEEEDAAPADPPIRLENVEETFNEIFSSRTPTLEVRSRLGTLHTPGNTSAYLSDPQTPLWEPELFDKSPDGASSGEGKLLSDLFASSQKRSPVVTNGSSSASEASDPGLQRDRHPTASSGKSVTFAEAHTEHTYSAYESMNSSKGASLLDDSHSSSAPPAAGNGTAGKTGESPEDVIARYQRLKASAMALMAEEAETDPLQSTLAKLSINTEELGGAAEPLLSDKFLEHSPRKDEDEEDYRKGLQLSGLHDDVFSSPLGQARGRLDWEDDVEPRQTTMNSGDRYGFTSGPVWSETQTVTPNRTPVHPAVNRIRKASGTGDSSSALANSPVTDWLHSDGRPNFLNADSEFPPRRESLGVFLGVDDTILVPPSPLESHQYSFSDTPTPGRGAARGSPTVGHLIDF